MRQSRLESYFTIPTKPRPCLGVNFLSLPPSVRRRIYEFANLADQVIDLNFSNLLLYPPDTYPDSTLALRSLCGDAIYPARRLRDHQLQFSEDEVWELDGDDSVDDNLPYHPCWSDSDFNEGFGLLFVSKRISKEVIDFVYSSNRFTVRQGSPHSLKRLKGLGQSGLAVLTSLTIKLDGIDRRESCAYPDNDTPLEQVWPTPLYRNDSFGSAVRREYEEAIQRLALFVRPNTLKLSLIFRAWDVDTVHTVLEPLFQLPLLKDCGIWATVGTKTPKLPFLQWPIDSCALSPRAWSKRANSQQSHVESIIQAAIHRLTENTIPPGQVFPYIALPAEIRLRILEFTDLVSKEDIQWRPRMSNLPWGRIKTFDCHCVNTYGIYALEQAGGCICEHDRYRSWKSHQRWLMNLPQEEPCCQVCSPTLATNLCFCSSEGSVFSTTCVCQRSRHALFSVNRRVREDAITTYYSQNRFVITPFRSRSFQELRKNSLDWCPCGIPGMRNVELSLYLSSVTRYALKHIRWLEWLLPNCPVDYLHPESRTWLDYLDTLSMMRHAMNIQNLTFVVNMAAAGEGLTSDVQQLMRPVHPREFRWYGRIALALRRLGPLKDCFIYLSRSSSYPKEVARRESALEKTIMGPGYDSQKRGKPRERMTAFAMKHWDHSPFLSEDLGL